MQKSELILGINTTTATATRITSDGAAASSSNGPILPNTSTYRCRVEVVARNTTTGDSASWDCKALLHREANAASTVVIGTPSVTQEFASSAMTACAIALSADTTLGGLAITATGIASTNIRWVAYVETVEVTN